MSSTKFLRTIHLLHFKCCQAILMKKLSLQELRGHVQFVELVLFTEGCSLCNIANEVIHIIEFLLAEVFLHRG